MEFHDVLKFNMFTGAVEWGTLAEEVENVCHNLKVNGSIGLELQDKEYRWTLLLSFSWYKHVWLQLISAFACVLVGTYD